MFALHHVTRGHRHVVAQIVETKLVVGAECDVARICLATGCGVGLVLVDTVDCLAMEHVKRAHPLGVAL